MAHKWTIQSVARGVECPPRMMIRLPMDYGRLPFNGGQFLSLVVDLFAVDVVLILFTAARFLVGDHFDDLSKYNFRSDRVGATQADDAATTWLPIQLFWDDFSDWSILIYRTISITRGLA